MRRFLFVRHIFLLGLCVFFTPFFFTTEVVAQTGEVLTGSKLSSGFDMGVNSSGGRTDWLKNEGEYIKMAYPAGQSWGAVFITVGKPKQPPRPSRDFSAFDTLLAEMRGESGGEQLEIGLKTNEQPDDGSETKRPVALTSEWRTYKFPLDEFTGTDVRRLYVVAEFVFSGPSAQTVYLRNVRYSGMGGGTGNGGDRSVTKSTPSPPPASPAPQVSISYPTDGTEVHTLPGKRPSILVRGTAEAIPAGWKLYLVVHPTQSDNVWANEIALGGKEWVSQAYLGGPGGLPNNDDMFEIFTTLRATDNPLPSTFVMQDQPLLHPSKVVTVKVKIVSWSDRAVAYAKDLQISGPIAAVFTALGGVIGAILASRSRLSRR